MILAAVVLWQTTPKVPPFAKEIAAFGEVDRKNPPAKGQVLFVGSSSFTNWKDAQKAFPNHPILNRAFGGSSLPHIIMYANEVIFQYQPRQVVIYCGENDLAGDPKLPAYEVYNRFVKLFRLVRSKLPTVPIAYVGMKPSPSRWHLRAKFIAGNRWIAEFLKHEKDTAYIDVWDAMLGKDGLPLPEIFIKDNLHMNAKGYAIWTPIIEPLLK